MPRQMQPPSRSTLCMYFVFIFLFIFYVHPQVRPRFIPSFCVQLTFSVSNFIYYNDFRSVLTLCFRFLIFPFSLYHFPFPIAHFSFSLLRASPALSAVDWRSLIRCNLKMLQRSNCFAANEIGAARGVYVIYAYPTSLSWQKQSWLKNVHNNFNRLSLAAHSSCCLSR